MPCVSVQLRDGSSVRFQVRGEPTEKDIAALTEFAQELRDRADEQQMLKTPEWARTGALKAQKG